MFYGSFVFLYLFQSFGIIQAGKITPSEWSTNNDEKWRGIQKLSLDTEPVLLDFTGGHLEDELSEATQDEEHRRWKINDGQLDGAAGHTLSSVSDVLSQLTIAEATVDDAQVPSSLNKDLPETMSDESFVYVTLPSSASSSANQEAKQFLLDRVAPGGVPAGIVVQNYSLSDKSNLIRLYQSNAREHRRQLFDYISRHTHNRYMNCISNFRKWILKPHLDQPIFYRNCVPCANAVDLNLQSLFDQQGHTGELQHYFVKTCSRENQWAAHIHDLEDLLADLKPNTGSTFTEVVRRNLLPNHRYVLQGIVKSHRGLDHRGFLHVCNLVSDETGHAWIIDGQIEAVFDLHEPDDIRQLDAKYRADYVARAFTGLFRPSPPA